MGKCREIKQERKDDCIFCQIADKKIPATYIYEDDDIMVIENISPVAKVHVLVIPKSHIELKNFKGEGCDRKILADLLLMVRETAKKQGILESGFRTIINTGKDAQADFEHLHLHVIGGEKLGDHL